MRISDGSSDVCSSDLLDALAHRFQVSERGAALDGRTEPGENLGENCLGLALRQGEQEIEAVPQGGEAEGAERAARKVDAAVRNAQALGQQAPGGAGRLEQRSEERRVGKEWGSTGRSRGSPCHKKKKDKS